MDIHSEYPEPSEEELGKFIRRAMKYGRTPKFVADALRAMQANWSLDSGLLSDFDARPIEYLWYPRLPLGKPVLLAGDPGLGKSLLTNDLLARTTSGDPWPDNATDPGGSPGQQRDPRYAMLLSAEDNPHDTIRPRFDALRGDTKRLVVVKGIVNPAGTERELLSLTHHMAILRESIDFYRPALVVIDPIDAFMRGVDTRSNIEVRGAIQPLADLAAEYRFALLFVHHLNKAPGGGGKNIGYRVSGSIAYVAAARIAYMLLADDTDELLDRRYWMCFKSNIGRRPPGLAFRAISRRVEYPGLAFETGFPEWEPGDVTESVEKLAERFATAKDDDSAVGRAKQFLREELAHGPQLVRDIEINAKAAGINWSSVQRARDALFVIHRKQTKQEDDQMRWIWELPQAGPSAHPSGNGKAAAGANGDVCVVCDRPAWRYTLKNRPVCEHHAPSEDQLWPANLDPTKPAHEE